MRRYPPLLPDSSSRKKKKKDKDKAKLLEAMGTSKKNEEEKRRGLDKRTPAQAAFEKMQEKRVRRVGSLGMCPSSRVGVSLDGFRGKTRDARGRENGQRGP